MKRIRKCLLACVATILASSPALADPAPYTMYASAPQAGQPIRLTVNRSDLSTWTTVVLSTKSNTALINTDFQGGDISVTFARQQVSATVLIPTYVDTAKYGQTLKVGLIVSVAGTPVASMLTSIIEPAAPAPAPTPTPTPTPTPAPAPTGTITSWGTAPLTVGGYACNAIQENTQNIGPCGSSIVYRITGTVQSASEQPVTLYATVFAQDASGNFPTNDTYATTVVGYFPAEALKGISPR